MKRLALLAGLSLAVGLLAAQEERDGANVATSTGDAADVPTLVAELSARDALTRGRAARALGALGADAEVATPPLLALLGDDRSFAWLAPVAVDGHVDASTPGYEAAKALVQIGKPGVDGLVRAWQRRSAYGRLMTVLSLAPLNDPRSVDVLIEGLRDRNADVRETAAKYLPYDDARTIEPVVEALDDRSAVVRAEAARRLAGQRAAEPAARRLREMARSDEAVDAACNAIYTLAAVPDPDSAAALTSTLDDPRRDPLVRACAARGLSAFRGSAAAFAALRSAADDPNLDVATSAVDAMGGVADERAVPFLLELLQTNTDDRRTHAVSALAEFGTPAAIEALVAVLAAPDYGPIARIAAVRGLGRIRDERARSALTAVLEDSDPQIRHEAARALSEERQ